ncbi:hypothetical protein [Parasphingorhabdus sp.]|uniref:hypothetical protein n=1 Tax=Parasphingorhabdus sp. TaxID=2709688 RepID=UPI003263D3E1
MIAIVTNTILAIFGLFFLYTGVISIRDPVGFARSLSLETVGWSGQVEIKAQYGGFFVAAAFSQFAPLVGMLNTQAALVVSLVIFGGLISGRLGALVVSARDEPLTSMIKSLYYIDGAGASASLALLFANGAF